MTGLILIEILLSAHGYPVKRLEEGVAEWQQAGYHLEKAETEKQLSRK